MLVHGGTSGIGTTAIQLGVAFGAGVFATAGSDAKVDACRHVEPGQGPGRWAPGRLADPKE